MLNMLVEYMNLNVTSVIYQGLDIIQKLNNILGL